VTNGIPLGCPLLLPVRTVNCVQTLQAMLVNHVSSEATKPFDRTSNPTPISDVDGGMDPNASTMNSDCTSMNPGTASMHARGSFFLSFYFRTFLHSRMPLVPTPARSKCCHACDQWHSSLGCPPPLTVRTFYAVTPLKADTTSVPVSPASQQPLHLQSIQRGATEFMVSQQPRHLIDAYCGVGLFALSLARDFVSVLGVEVCKVRCAFFDLILHSMMSSDPTHVRLKRTHASDQ
jgi:hypothetical protein